MIRSTLLLIIFCVCLWRLSEIFRERPKEKRSESDTCNLAVFLGSGGHTTEALALLDSLHFSRYTPRTYILCEGDELSEAKARKLEHSKNPLNEVNILRVPRARNVHQSLLTTPITALYSLCHCIYHVAIAPLRRGTHFADVLILNGPGTCFMLCIAVYFNKFFGLKSPRLIYVESFARVHSLSLSGKLIRPFIDRFVVQWPTLVDNAGKSQYHGWLV